MRRLLPFALLAAGYIGVFLLNGMPVLVACGSAALTIGLLVCLVGVH